jgi:predicted RNA methylase
MLLLIAACGGGGVAAGIATLGAPFVAAFNTNANGAALADPATAGLVVNPNIDPFNP